MMVGTPPHGAAVRTVVSTRRGRDAGEVKQSLHQHSELDSLCPTEAWLEGSCRKNRALRPGSPGSPLFETSSGREAKRLTLLAHLIHNAANLAWDRVTDMFCQADGDIHRKGQERLEELRRNTAPSPNICWSVGDVLAAALDRRSSPREDDANRRIRHCGQAPTCDRPR